MQISMQDSQDLCPNQDGAENLRVVLVLLVRAKQILWQPGHLARLTYVLV